MFYVNQPSIDYLTVTTFNPVLVDYLTKVLTETARHHDEPKKRMQYTGRLYHHEEGTAYVGEGEQKGKSHHLVQISGLWGDTLWPVVRPFIVGGTANITRIDLQISVQYDRDTWSQVALAERLRKQGRMSVSYLESKSGPAQSTLATVYFGSRQSDRFVRIYEKMGLGEDVFLRFEVEMKSPRSKAAALALAEETTPRAILAHELDRVRDEVLRAQFFPLTHHAGWEVKAVKPTPATVRWLVEQVAPALARVVNDHNIDTVAVEELFKRILDEGGV